MRQDIITLQNLINSGMAWTLEGSIGRTCMAALENGDVMLGTEIKYDFYGNHIPARTMVQPGTKGSRQLVVDTHGEEYAAELELVPDTFMIENFLSNC